MEKYVQHLLIPIQQTRIGIQWNHSNSTSLPPDLKQISNFNLKCLIPYAQQTLTWEMNFNSSHPELGPEFIFEDDDYLQDETIEGFANKVPNLINWNRIRSKSLLNAFDDLLQVYKEYHIKLLKVHAEKLSLEYTSLISSVNSKNVEIVLFQRSKQFEIRFLIKFNFYLPRISHLPENQNTEVVLVMYFFGPTYNRVTPELHLSQYLEHLFDGSESLHIPPYVETLSLIDYVQKIQQCIHEKIFTVSRSFERRKNFVCTLLTLQWATVIEYDITKYEKVALLLEHSNFYFILTFILPTSFPREKFLMKLYSVYHMSEQGKPMYKNIEGFPYNLHWEFKKMIVEALEFVLRNEVEKFKKSSIKNTHI